MPITSSSLLRLLALPALLSCLTNAAGAQCTYSWPAAFGSGTDDAVAAMTVAANGDLVVGGRFTTAGGVAAGHIARFDGAAWSALGGGMDLDVYALLTMPNGDLVAGGAFLTAGGITVNGVARWDGSTWNALGNGIDPIAVFGARVQAMAVMPNGDLIVAGSFPGASGVAASNIARWDGASWSALGSGLDGIARGLAVAADGDLIVVGSFTLAGGVAASNIARWNGTAWSALGAGLDLFGGTAVAVMPNGEVVASGPFVAAGGIAAERIAQWDGTSWSALGSGLDGNPNTMLPLPTGELLVGGTFTHAGGVPANRVAKWNGTTWAEVGFGTDAAVDDLVLMPDASVVVGGEFATAGASAVGRVAKIASSCAPQVTSIGAGCTGGAGVVTLVATQYPMLGTTVRMVGTGMPALGFVLAVSGFSSISLPLTVVFAEALPGCDLYVSPDFLDVLVPVAGLAMSAIVVPDNPSLAGASLWHQYVPLESDAQFHLLAVSSSNALQLTVGTF